MPMPTSKRSLIVVDVQNDYFPNGKWTLAGIEAAADNVGRLLADARKSGDLVIHIRHEFASESAPFFTPGSEGAKIHPKAINQPEEKVILKHYVNSFRETDLKATLDQHQISDLTICGAMSHMCVDAITRASNDFGYACTVVHDACASRDMEFGGVEVPARHVHAAFMAALGFAYATMMSTDEYLASKS